VIVRHAVYGMPAPHVVTTQTSTRMKEFTYALYVLWGGMLSRAADRTRHCTACSLIKFRFHEIVHLLRTERLLLVTLLVGKLIVVQLVKKRSVFLKPRSSLQCSQNPSLLRARSSLNAVYIVTACSCNIYIYFNIILLFSPTIPKRSPPFICFD